MCGLLFFNKIRKNHIPITAFTETFVIPYLIKRDNICVLCLS